MKKGVVLPIFLVVLIFGAYIVTAIESRVSISRGWNLVYGFNADEPVKKILQGSEIKDENIKAIYVYLPQINEYGRVYPKTETIKIFKYLTIDELENSVYWVYSDKSGIGKFNVDEPIEITERVLSSGWNFYPIYESMIGRRVRDFRGNCDVEKVYGFEPTRQEWVNMVDEEMQKEAVGLGFVVKVKNQCKFGFVDENVSTPPKIPSTDNPDVSNKCTSETQMNCNSCMVAAPFNCNAASIDFSAGTISLEIRNGGGEAFNISAITLDGCGGGSNSSVGVTPADTLTTMIVPCTGLTTGITFKSNISVTYRKIGSNLDQVATGRIRWIGEDNWLTDY